jgi:hypothetical protein
MSLIALRGITDDTAATCDMSAFDALAFGEPLLIQVVRTGVWPVPCGDQPSALSNGTEPMSRSRAL